MNPPAAATLDMTQIILAVIGGVMSIIVTVATALINAKIKDATARKTLADAVTNGAGAVLQASKGLVTASAPVITIPGVPAATAIGVQYVLDHAGDEAKFLGFSTDSIADKINAKIGVLTAAPGAAPV